MQRVRKQIDFFPGNGLEEGEGVTVAVLDSGVGRHPDLAGKIRGFRDFVGGRELPYDDNGHGTHVCGRKHKKRDKASKHIFTTYLILK